MSVDSTETSAVNGGKVWTPKNGGKIVRLIDPSSAFMMLFTFIAIFAFSVNSVYFAGEINLDGPMTKEIWDENERVFKHQVYGTLGLMAASGTILTLVIFLQHTILKVLTFLVALGVLVLTAINIPALDHHPTRNWFEQEYGYKITNSEGHVYDVEDIETGDEKVVNRYVVDGFVYLAESEDALKKQLGVDDLSK